jgi:hypothetical protein
MLISASSTATSSSIIGTSLEVNVIGIGSSAVLLVTRPVPRTIRATA